MTPLSALLLPAFLAAQGPDKAQRHYEAGLAMLSQGRALDARGELGVAGLLAPGRTDIREAMLRAEAGLPAGPKPKAKPSPPGLDACLAEAGEAYRFSEEARARAAWRRALQLDPGNRKAQAGLALLEEEAYRADRDAPFDGAVGELYQSALRDARKGRHAQAKRKLDEARSLNPIQDQLQALAARVEARLSSHPEAEAARQAEARLRRGEARAGAARLYGQGMQAWQAGQLALAAARFKQGLELKPRDRDLARALGLVEEKLARQLEDAGREAREFTAQARTLESQGRLEEALRAYERAAARDSASGADARMEAERLRREIGN